MDIGLVKDRRPFEHRIGLTPGGVKALTDRGHRVYVENDAGVGAGFTNEDYREVGATIVYSEEEVLLRSQLVLRISPPAPGRVRALPARAGGDLVVAPGAGARPTGFTILLERKITTVGYEIIEDDDGHAPVLEAMSEIAGRLAVIIGSGLLLNEFGGKGLLIGGCAGHSAGLDGDPRRRHPRPRGRRDRARASAPTWWCSTATSTPCAGSRTRVGSEVPTMVATRRNIEKALAFADLFLCAVAVHGERTPILVTRDMLKLMKPRSVDHGPVDRPGRLLRDLAADRLLEPDLRGRRHHPLLRAEPAVDGVAGLDPRPHQRDPALRRGDRRQGLRRRRSRDNAALRRGTYTYDGACVRQGLAETLRRAATATSVRRRVMNWIDIYRSRVTTADEAVSGHPIRRPGLDPPRLQHPDPADRRHGGPGAGAARTWRSSTS